MLFGALIYLSCVASVTLFEILLLGWNKSSLKILLQPSRNNIINFLVIFAEAIGAKGILGNLLYFGLLNLVYSKITSAGIGPLITTNNISTFFLLLLVGDFLNYWVHWISHRSSLFWIVHQFHHSSNLLTIYSNDRSHPLNSVVPVLISALPIKILFAASPEVSMAFDLTVILKGLITHSRIDSDFGWLGKIFVSPRHHHLHHALANTQGSNLGDIFIFWDKIFGTYSPPTQPISEITVGIEDNIYIKEPFYKAFPISVYRFYAHLFRVKI